MQFISDEFSVRVKIGKFFHKLDLYVILYINLIHKILPPFSSHIKRVKIGSKILWIPFICITTHKWDPLKKYFHFYPQIKHTLKVKK